MAGGKESPRQKMIGMMYLVLTALLALQVSAAIMEKFILLDQSLKGTAMKQEVVNDATVDRIAKSVADRNNKPEEVALLEDAKKVKEMTHDVIDKYLEKDIRKKFVEDNGGWEEGKEGTKPKNAKDTEVTNQFFVGIEGKKNGKAYEIKKKLDKYIDDLTAIAKKNGIEVGPGKELELPLIAMGGKEHPIFKDDPDQKRKDFAKLNFEDSPMVAALATLSELEAKIVKAEGDLLNALASKVGAADFKFDLPSAMFRAPSSTIAAGTDYEAEMFIAATASTIKPEMWWKHGTHPKDKKGKPVEVTPKDLEGKDVKKIDKLDEKGRGQLKFRASGGGYDKEGKAKKKWTGYVKIPKPTGGDTIFVVDAEYIVAKPVIQVQSGAISALYKDCGNLLDIQVPALGALYKPSFSVSGGSKTMGKKKGQVIIVPNRPTVAITVSSGGTRIGTEKFKVRLVPKPDILVKLPNGKEANVKRGERAGAVRSLRVVAECSDDNFKQNLPRDARYFVSKWEVMLVRGKRPVNKQTVSGSSYNVSRLGQQRPGDRILIDVKSVARKNYQNRTLPVTIGTTIINIPLTD